MPPLYKITEGNGKSYKYLKDDQALADYRASHPTNSYMVNRLKGLGEMSADEVSETLMNKDTRIIRQISVGDEATANILFEQMMGTGATARKQFLKQYSEESIYNAE